MICTYHMRIYKAEKQSVCPSHLTSHVFLDNCPIDWCDFGAKQNAHHLASQSLLSEVPNHCTLPSTAPWMPGCSANFTYIPVKTTAQIPMLSELILRSRVWILQWTFLCHKLSFMDSTKATITWNMLLPTCGSAEEAIIWDTPPTARRGGTCSRLY